MTERNLEFEDIQDRFGISFGLGIDIEAQYECFQIYSACGIQLEDYASTKPTETQSQHPGPTWLYDPDADR